MKIKPTSAAASTSEGRFAYEGLDRVIHERARLSVLTSLLTNPKGLTFGDLKQLCALTDGNLNRHLSVLERAKLVEIVKGHDHNRPQTVCRITANGRKRYLDYLSDARAGGQGCSKRNRRGIGVHRNTRPDTTRGVTPFFKHLLCNAK